MNQQLTPDQVVGFLETANLPPGSKIIVIAIPPEGADPAPVDFVARKNQKDYRRFVTTSKAIALMETEIKPRRLRELASQAIAGELRGFTQGVHFKDLAKYGSAKARWVFNPEACDRFLSKPAEERLKPARRRKAS